MSALLAGYVVLIVTESEVIGAGPVRDLSWDGELYADLDEARRNLADAADRGYQVELGVVATVPITLPVDQIAEVGVTLRMHPLAEHVNITLALPVAALEAPASAEPPADR